MDASSLFFWYKKEKETMNYLINPLWIYLLDVLKDIESTFCLICIFSGCITLVAGVLAVCMFAFGYDKNEAPYKVSKKVTKIGTIVAIITGIIVCFIPSEKTMYTMFVASYVTEENIDAAGETVTEMIDYIFEKVDELQDNNDTE